MKEVVEILEQEQEQVLKRLDDLDSNYSKLNEEISITVKIIKTLEEKKRKLGLCIEFLRDMAT